MYPGWVRRVPYRVVQGQYMVGSGPVYGGQGQYMASIMEARINNIVLFSVSAKEAISWKSTKTMKLVVFRHFQLFSEKKSEKLSKSTGV